MHTQPIAAARAPTDGSLREQIRVLLVDDHPAVRVGAQELIDDQPDMRVVTQARSAEEALRQLRQHDIAVDVAVVDYHLREGRDGLWLATELAGNMPPPPVLIYSAFADGTLAVLAPVAGADGLLGKHELGDELCRAIRRLARGQQHLPAPPRSIAHVLASRLEPDDQPIFKMLLDGVEREVIAERLGITPQELHARRSIILGALHRARAAAAVPPSAQTPLDYERRRRRPTPLASTSLGSRI
jgi:two-component system, NarL family, response regulator DevR